MKSSDIKKNINVFEIEINIWLKNLEAYIQINTEAGKLWDVAREAMKLPGVKMAHAVTGQFDVIIYVELETISDLEKIISIEYNI